MRFDRNLLGLPLPLCHNLFHLYPHIALPWDQKLGWTNQEQRNDDGDVHYADDRPRG